jgi:hypothetical protein
MTADPTFNPQRQPIEALLAPRARRQDMAGFDPEYSDFVDYILRCTHRIWEEKGVSLIRTHYSDDCALHTLAGPVTGMDAVIANTDSTLAAFPDRALLGEDVIWSQTSDAAFFSSHRIVSPMTHLGDDGFGPATGRTAIVMTIADCVVEKNLIVEEWLVRDNLWLVRQLGLDPWEIAARQAERDKTLPQATHAWRLAELEAFGGGPPEAPASQWVEALQATLQSNHDAAMRAYAPHAEVRWPSGRRIEGNGAMPALWLHLRSALPDLRVRVHQTTRLEDGPGAERVAIRWWARGSHRGDGLWGRATGKNILVLGVTHVRTERGLIVAEETVFDELAVLRQVCGGLGA